jgi:hypothetical protein
MTDLFRELTTGVQARTFELACLMWEAAGRQQGMALEYWITVENEVYSLLKATATRMMPNSGAANNDNGEARPDPATGDSDIVVDPGLAAAPPRPSADAGDFAPRKTMAVEAEAVAPAAAQRPRKAATRAKNKA